MESKKIKIEVSNRHVHLSKKHIEILFGGSYKLKVHRELSQPGQFAAKEKVTLIHNDKKIENVRVLGPYRNETQVEILQADADLLGLKIPKRLSGELHETPGIIIKGPNGRVELEKGVIISHRHLHASLEEARELGIEHGQKVNIRILIEPDAPDSENPENEIEQMILEDVVVRVGDEYRLSVHIDCEEGKKCCVLREGYGELVLE